MMRKIINYKLWVMGFAFFLFLAHNHCCAQSVSSSELIENADNYDTKEVVYEGEVIGDVMQRKDGVWVNISDGENSIGVWMSAELAGTIQYKGSYKAQGDTVKVKGIFNRACSQHGGDLDIHAASLVKLKSGWAKQEKVVSAKRNLLIMLVVALCLILILRISIIR